MNSDNESSYSDHSSEAEEEISLEKLYDKRKKSKAEKNLERRAQESIKDADRTNHIEENKMKESAIKTRFNHLLSTDPIPCKTANITLDSFAGRWTDKTYIKHIYPAAKNNYSMVMMNFPYGLYVHKNCAKFWFSYQDQVAFNNKTDLYKNPISGVETNKESLQHQYLSLAEKPCKEGPVRIDVDLHNNLNEIEENEPVYTYDQVEKVVGHLQEILVDLFYYYDQSANPPDRRKNIKEKSLYTLLLEKPPRKVETMNGDVMKQGFHLHLPYFWIDNSILSQIVIPLLQERCNGLFDVDSAIDKQAATVPWLLYGSTKQNNDMIPYKVTKGFDHNLKPIDWREELKDYSLRYDGKSDTMNGRYYEVQDVEWNLPRILSIVPNGREFMYFHTPRENYNIKTVMYKKDLEDIIDIPDTEYVFDPKVHGKDLVHYLQMLSSNRADDYANWITIGQAIFGTTKGSNEGLKIWTKWSQQSAKFYDKDHSGITGSTFCASKWETFSDTKYSIGTIRMYAKADNPESYAQYNWERTKHLNDNFINGSHCGIAELLFEEYKNEFVCTSIARKKWMRFNGVHWEPMEEATNLRALISNPKGIVMTKLHKMIKNYKELLTKDEIDKSKVQKTIKFIQTTIKNCESSPFKSNVIRESAERFFDKTFNTKLDQNKYIIAFNNGVYDLEMHHFREGQPEDYITKSLPIPYKKYSNTCEDIENVQDFFLKIHPDKDIRQYFVSWLSRIFVGGNADKEIVFFSGSGNNGKTVLQLLLDKMLGKMAVKLSTAVVTGKKPSSNAANPEMARLKGGVRLATMDEPNPDECINPGILKMLNGNDRFCGRDLYEPASEMVEIEPMFKTVMIVNNPPAMDRMDDATAQRINVFLFESKFVQDGAPETLEEQIAAKKFPMDKRFSDRIPKMTAPLAYFLLEHLKKPKVEKPDKLKIATRNYIQDNDHVEIFIEKNLTFSTDDTLNLTSIYNRFKHWFTNQYPKQSLPSRHLVKMAVSKHFTEEDESFNNVQFKSNMSFDI